MWFSGLRGAIAYALSLHLEFKEETRKVTTSLPSSPSLFSLSLPLPFSPRPSLSPFPFSNLRSSFLVLSLKSFCHLFCFPCFLFFLSSTQITLFKDYYKRRIQCNSKVLTYLRKIANKRATVQYIYLYISIVSVRLSVYQSIYLLI